jgi:DNA-binding NtrC family response regulator
MPFTVLVVDDDPGVRDSTRLALMREGYDVLVAPDGMSAIQMMTAQEQARHVCTLLCDLEMPNGSGRDVIAYCQAHHSTVPIIIMSGTDDTRFLDSIVQDGVSDWMRKPVRRDILVQKVKTAVHLFTLRQQERV